MTELWTQTSYAKMFGSNERLIKFWLPHVIIHTNSLSAVYHPKSAPIKKIKKSLKKKTRKNHLLAMEDLFYLDD